MGPWIGGGEVSVTLADGARVYVENPDVDVQVVAPQTRVRIADAPNVTVVGEDTSEIPDLALIYENRKV